ncbi:MAG TPA: M13 family metallopeptidase [Gemmatimonadales bacterium]|nr:M13 family metallopeptidase [Gemmatimonadales bacterium]
MRVWRWVFPAVLAVSTAVTGTLAAQHGVARSNMDTTCAPCRDFFEFANGAWLKSATIPPAYTNIGAARELVDRNNDALREVLDAAAAAGDTARDSAAQRVGAFYGSCMDSVAVDRAGSEPIAGALRDIAAIATKDDVQAEIARLLQVGIFAPFYFSSEADPKQSTRNIGQLYQSGLGLPDRDYYLKTDPASDSLRQSYVAHVARTLALVGTAPPAARQEADRVLALETALAESSMTLTAQRDPAAVYHKLTVPDLAAIAPAIAWPAFFAALGVPSLAAPGATLDVSQPAFLRQVNAQIATASLDTWRAYFRWHLADQLAPSLSAAFFDEHFRFQSSLEGVVTPLPRWKRCAAATDHALGEALGQAYVAREFPAASKARVLEIVNNLQSAFASHIRQLAWLGDSTKARAVVKLSALAKQIGYPDKWRDYTALVVQQSNPYGVNVLRARAFEAARQRAKIGAPVDRGEWFMTAPTVNAYYSPTNNEITFPAGILRPPYFDPEADEAVNYGAIGAIIGHEMTHGFDDQGRQYDAGGNLHNWWTLDDARRFTARAARVVAQFDGYLVVDTFHVNGALTLGENIADLGGLSIAFDALERWLATHPRTVIDGFTPEQRFFLGYAQGWRSLTRPEVLRLRALTDPHSPPRWRVNGPLSNLPAFARAFGCAAGDSMVRADSVRAEVW